MKTNYLTLSVMALAAAFTACSQDNEILETNVSDNAQVLTIQAAESGFEAADAESRATDNGKTTKFENGDQMGLFVVRDNGSVVKANEPITYNSATKTWTPTTTVYYYTNADYIAYFPYDEDLSVSETTTTDITDGIISAFDTYFKKHKADQSNLETYRNADLMLSTITAAALAEQTTENKTLNFALKHNYSMIELNIPSHKYKYTYGEGTREFAIPMSNFVVKLGTTEVQPCHIGSGVYRMLVEPEEEITLTGSFEDPKDQCPVNFSNASSDTKKLAAGSYVKYNISYDEAPSGEAVERNIIGDYYCQDGSIYPSELKAVPDNVIGIVFSTVGDDEELGKEGYEYYVLSNKERNHIGFLVNNNPSDASLVNIEGIPNYTFDATAACLGDMTGFSSTGILRGLNYYITEDLGKKWTNAPTEGTTGWFIPSIGQWAKLYSLTGETATYSLDGANLKSDKVGSVTDWFVELNNANVATMTGCYWSTTQAATETVDNVTNSQIYFLDLSGTNREENKEGKFNITVKKKTEKQNRKLRPILAF